MHVIMVYHKQDNDKLDVNVTAPIVISGADALED